MKKILETERLYLREFELVDAENMYLLNSDPDVVRYTGDPPFESVEDAREFLQNYPDYKLHGFGRWPVILKDGDRFVGWNGLKHHSDGMIDIGFRFFQKDWGKGYATESAKAVLDYGFSELHMDEIVGRAAKANTASLKVLEKLGMSYWKKAPCHGIEDALYYRITVKNEMDD